MRDFAEELPSEVLASMSSSFFADGGFFGALQTGRLDMSALMPPAE